MVVCRLGAGAAPASPCVNVCALDAATGWCLGCGRTGAEIGAWVGLSDADKRRLLEALPARLAKLAAQAKPAAPPK
jgi:hypothetical protein